MSTLINFERIKVMLGRKIYNGTKVILKDNVYNCEKTGTLFLPPLDTWKYDNVSEEWFTDFTERTVEESELGIYTIILDNGQRYRNEGILQIV